MNIKIESGHDIPSGNRALIGAMHDLRRTLETMLDGESFIWPDARVCWRAAIQIKVKIKTRKISGRGFRVWRVGKNV